MKVADVMTRSVDFVAPSATVQEAATRMAELDVGATLIGSDEEGVVGILTDRDILLRVVVEGKNPAYVTVAEVMSAKVVGCFEDDQVEAAFAKMREGQFRRMPVFDAEKYPVGVVTISDLAKHIDGPENVRESLRAISEPHRTRMEKPEADDADDPEPEPKAARA
jgi:CBS domain-containing protein